MGLIKRKGLVFVPENEFVGMMGLRLLVLRLTEKCMWAC